MDAISIRCKSCQHAMKFSPDKAGKKAKCPKCGSIVVINVDEVAKESAPPAAPPQDADMPKLEELPDIVAETARANEKDKVDLWTDDGPATYEAKVDEELVARQKALAEEEERKATQKKPKDKKKLPKVGRKVKALPDAESWKKVRMGLLFVSIACWVWLGTHLLQGSYVLLGSTEFSEYSNMISKYLSQRQDDPFPQPGHFWHVDELGLYLEMIGGKDWGPYAAVALTLATILYFLQAVMWAAGYGFCVAVPRRYGMFGQVIGLLGLAGINIILIFSLKLLPVLGVHNYVLIPYVVPEIVMTEYNFERIVPIHILFSAEPFWEHLLALFVRGIQYFEPTLMCIFIWSVGVAIKSPEIEAGGKRMTYWGLGTLFALLCFHVLSLAGGSNVLVTVLRVIYTCWYCFLLGFILNFSLVLMKTRSVLDEKINPRFELRE